VSAGPSYDVGVCWEQVVRLDRTYAAPARRGGGLFALHDWPVLLDLLARVRATPTPSRLAHATRQYDGREGVVDVPMPAVVLVEGIRVIRAETLPLLDLAVWIDLDLWDSRWVPEGQEYQRAVRPEQLAHLVMAAGGRD
jgi:hypothetical protein